MNEPISSIEIVRNVLKQTGAIVEQQIEGDHYSIILYFTKWQVTLIKTFF
jgi:hypothetical protein